MTSQTDYKNRHVVVTGCASGIGRATAALLVDMGAKVHGLDVKSCDLALDRFTMLDLADPESIENAVAEVGNGVQALFNCAGVPPTLPPLDVFKVNFAGTRMLAEGVASGMGRGSAIVNVSSNGGAGWASHLADLQQLVAAPSFTDALAWLQERPEAAQRAYSTSKEAMIVWTLVRSGSLIARGIRVNCTTPGAVQTPMLEEIERTTPAELIDTVAQPFGRRSSPEEQAWPLLFLNSDAAAYLNGVVLPVDGGFIAAQSLNPAPQTIGRK